MKINYNDWFYDQHRYLKTSDMQYTDTKWKTIADRYQNLLTQSSSLLTDQPYSVVGNSIGIEKLFKLLAESNYTFEDINKSLMETYRVSLKNAMSRSLVNTHAVIYYSNTQNEKTDLLDSKYYVVSVPFIQMHFGDRDEYIRKELHTLYTKSGGNYIDIIDFSAPYITENLGFTLLCTVGGRISNDCKVAISDQGFIFKMKYTGLKHADFIIYKLDRSYCFNFSNTSYSLSSTDATFTSTDILSKISQYNLIGKKCIVNIYSENMIEATSVPNFGYITADGIKVTNVQKFTMNELQYSGITNFSVTIHAIESFDEVQDMYPATNIFQYDETQLIYDSQYNNIADKNGNRVYESKNDMTSLSNDIITPPIILDRPTDSRFADVIAFAKLKSLLLDLTDDIKSIGTTILNSHNTTFPNYTFFKNTITLCRQLSVTLTLYYKRYLKASQLLSSIPKIYVNEFNTFLNNIDNIAVMTQTTFNYATILGSTCNSDLYYYDNYVTFVNKIMLMLDDESLSTYANFTNVNYYTDHISINRPVAEQSLIALKYDTTTESLLFTYPNIKHFNGLENVFYIDEDLTGTEVFKFFVIYTNTESPDVTTSPELTFDEVMDFDKFYTETSRYIGYIRYWYAENKLMKLSKLLYNEYNDDSVDKTINYLLKNHGDDSLITLYPSDMNYEPSNVTTDNVDSYTETSERAPFEINFLFYILKCLNQDQDQFQSYFYWYLSKLDYTNRYVDINLSNLISEKSSVKMNYSGYSKAPNNVPYYNTTGKKINMYYGLPFVCGNNTQLVSSPYRYTFNVYNNDIPFYLVDDNTISKDYNITYTTTTPVKNYDSTRITFETDVKLCKLCAKILRYYYDICAHLDLNDTNSWNQIQYITSLDFSQFQTEFNEIIYGGPSLPPVLHRSSNLSMLGNISTFLTNAPNRLNDIKTAMNNLYIYNNRTIYSMIDSLLNNMTYIHKNFGFRNIDVPVADYVYKKFKALRDPKLSLEKLLSEFKDTTEVARIYNLLNILDNLVSEKFTTADKTEFGRYESFKSIATKFAAFSIYTKATAIRTAIANNLYDSTLSACVTQMQYYIKSVLETNTTTTDYPDTAFYTIKNIALPQNVSLTTKPVYATMTLDAAYLMDGVTSTNTIILIPKLSKDNAKYVINEFVPICQYAFKSGTAVSRTITLYDEDNNSIGTYSLQVQFVQVSYSKDVYNDFDYLNDLETQVLDFQNHYEKETAVTSSSKNYLANEKEQKINYELLFGNHFKQLNHTSQKVMDRVTKLQGSIDRVRISNSELNLYAKQEFYHNDSIDVYVKPVQVFDKNVNSSLYRGFGEKIKPNQIIYVKPLNPIGHSEQDIKAKDYVFPIKITSVNKFSGDHSGGEAIVHPDAKWFKIDPSSMEYWVQSPTMTCQVLSDNVCNLLNEYNGDYANLSFLDNGSVVPSLPTSKDYSKHNFVYLGMVRYNSNETAENMGAPYANIPVSDDIPYEILREEPNDHDVWAAESVATNTDIKNEPISLIPDYEAELEKPTTWFDVISQEAADTYINNGRAKTNFKNNVYEQLPYPNYDAYMDGTTGKWTGTTTSGFPATTYTPCDILLFDATDNKWIDEFSLSSGNYIRNYIWKFNRELDTYIHQTSRHTIQSISIIPKVTTVFSDHKILVYFVYDNTKLRNTPLDKSMTYNSNTNHLVDVKFKCVVSSHSTNDYDPYDYIKIRKQFSGQEKYVFSGTDYTTTIPHYTKATYDFPINRVNQSGEYQKTPVFRVQDITVTNKTQSWNYENFSIYRKIGYNNITTTETYDTLTYTPTIVLNPSAIITQEENNLIVDINLISIDDNNFNGNISKVQFNATAKLNYTNQTITDITITGSNLSVYDTGTYKCTVRHTKTNTVNGGIVTVVVGKTQTSIVNGAYVKIPDSEKRYAVLPKEFIISMNSGITIDTTAPTYVQLKSDYQKTTTNAITEGNTNYAPFEYYVDTNKEVRYPISKTLYSDHTKRLVIDESVNTNVHKAQSTYIGICRYSTAEIPKDGIIDVTGYVPNPLSHNRYEFWVNGRFVNDDVIILSPTSFQLTNLMSLRNFELIELVQDINQCDLIDVKGVVYVGKDGRYYTNYTDIVKNNLIVKNQFFGFTFNVNQITGLQNYSKSLITPNNYDLETDILSYITLSDSSDYMDCINKPSLEGIVIDDIYTDDLPLNEIPNNEVIDIINDVWKYGYLENNDIDLMCLHDDEYVTIEKSADGNFVLCGNTEKYFMLYVSDKQSYDDDDISSTNTKLIIPYVKCGDEIVIPDAYKGYWLKTTFVNTNKVLI